MRKEGFDKEPDIVEKAVVLKLVNIKQQRVLNGGGVGQRPKMIERVIAVPDMKPYPNGEVTEEEPHDWREVEWH